MKNTNRKIIDCEYRANPVCTGLCQPRKNVVDIAVRRRGQGKRALVHSFAVSHSLFPLFSFVFSHCFSLSLSHSFFSLDVAHASITRIGLSTRHVQRISLMLLLTFRYGVVDVLMRMACGGLILFSSNTPRNTSTMQVRNSGCTRRPCDGITETSVDHGGRAAHETKWEAKRPRGHPVANTSTHVRKSCSH